MDVNDEEAGAREVVRKAALRTSDEGGVRLFSAGRRGSPVGEELGGTEGIADLRRRVARVSVQYVTPDFAREIDSRLSEAEAEDPEDDEMRQTVTSFIKMFSTTLENVHVGGATYTQVGDQGWANFSETARDAPRSPDDPLWLLDALVGVRDAMEVDREDVRGVPTTHYRLDIDLATADQELATGVIAPGPRSYRSLRALPADVWIDDDGRIRRLSYEREDNGMYWQTTELWDFGLEVEIEIPSEDELIGPSKADESPDDPGTHV
jgi:hypothetical protein